MVYFDPFSQAQTRNESVVVLMATLTCKREQWPPDVGVSILQESCTDERILRHGVATVDRLAGELLASSMARWSHEK